MKPLLNVDMPSFESRQEKFNELLNPEVCPNIGEEVEWKDPNRYACSCCGFPTLIRPGYCEMCTICEWEEENYPQDVDYGGRPNGPYSLFQSRKNVEVYGCMYGPEETHPDFQWSTAPGVLAAKQSLIRAYLKLLDIDRASSGWIKAWEDVVSHEIALMNVEKNSRDAYRAAHYGHAPRNSACDGSGSV